MRLTIWKSDHENKNYTRRNRSPCFINNINSIFINNLLININSGIDFYSVNLQFRCWNRYIHFLTKIFQQILQAVLDCIYMFQIYNLSYGHVDLH